MVHRYLQYQNLFVREEGMYITIYQWHNALNGKNYDDEQKLGYKFNKPGFFWRNESYADLLDVRKTCLTLIITSIMSLN